MKEDGGEVVVGSLCRDRRIVGKAAVISMWKKAVTAGVLGVRALLEISWKAFRTLRLTFALDVRSMALFRVLLAALVLIDLFDRWYYLREHYTDDGTSSLTQSQSTRTLNTTTTPSTQQAYCLGRVSLSILIL